jgi:hypothetical protein
MKFKKKLKKIQFTLTFKIVDFGHQPYTKKHHSNEKK